MGFYLGLCFEDIQSVLVEGMWPQDMGSPTERKEEAGSARLSNLKVGLQGSASPNKAASPTAGAILPESRTENQEFGHRQATPVKFHQHG